MNQDSFSAGLERLHQSYELFSFGYDSQKPVAVNQKEFGDELKRVFGEQQVVVLAHSMGGLVANAGGGNVGHLITVGTPYEGSPLVLCKALNSEGTRCAEGLIDMRLVENALSKAYTSAGSFELVESLNLHKLNMIIASFPGTLDLSSQSGGIPLGYLACSEHAYGEDPNPWFNCMDDVYEGRLVLISEPNPFLSSANANMPHANHTAFYGDASQRSIGLNRNLQIAFARAMQSFYGSGGDGVVPISSACRLGSSTGVVSNCAGSPFANLIDTEFTHTEIKDAPNMPAYTAELLRVADTLLDIDDGTLDGNQRTYIGTESSSAGCTDSEEDGVCDAAVDAEKPLAFIDADFGEIDVQPSGEVRYLRIGEDIDGNERFGDNSLDMSDFRRWRDWYIGSSPEAELDGSFNHMKKGASKF